MAARNCSVLIKVLQHQITKVAKLQQNYKNSRLHVSLFSAANGYRPAESSVCVLEEDARVSLSLQHPVPVKLIVCVQGTFEVLKQSQRKRVMKNRYFSLSLSLITLYRLTEK